MKTSSSPITSSDLLVDPINTLKVRRTFAGRLAADAARNVLEAMYGKQALLIVREFPSRLGLAMLAVRLGADLIPFAVLVAALYGQDWSKEEAHERMRERRLLPSPSARASVASGYLVAEPIGDLARSAVLKRAAERIVRSFETRAPGFIVPE
jgi:hypothetical protein